MPDEADLANEQAERHLEAARSKRRPVLFITGSCYNCGEPIGAREFCDADCRDDYERRERVGKLYG